MDGAKAKAESFTVLCVRCERPLSARREWVGREVQCPHCASALRVPPLPDGDRPVWGEAPALGAKYRFNFGCPRCRTLLEAHTGMCGHPGTCPTCAARLVVPDLDGSGMPRETKLLDTDDQDPTPLHAYAASGSQAPRILRQADGSLLIECPRCGARCEVDANSCVACGSPFTIEAAPTTTSYHAESWGTASLALGLLSLPLFFSFLPAILALVFGVMSLVSSAGQPKPNRAAIGIMLGLLSLGGGLTWWLL